MTLGITNAVILRSVYRYLLEYSSRISPFTGQFHLAIRAPIIVNSQADSLARHAAGGFWSDSRTVYASLTIKYVNSA